MEILENIGKIGNELFDNLSDLQNVFLESKVGQIANSAIDMGLKIILPDFIENEVIEVKDAFISKGIDEAINTAIDNAIELGKKTLGINDNEFKSIVEAGNALIKGDLGQGISEGIDFVLEKIEKSNILSENILELVKNGKDIILNQTSSNLNNELDNEIKVVQKIEKYIVNWEKCYKNKDIEGLTKEYNKIKKQEEKIMPLKNIMNSINKIENINEFIKNNENFNFDGLYLELAENL